MIGGSVTLELETYRSQAELYFLFRGRIVLDECERLRSSCLPMISKGVEQVFIDLSKVDFIDSAGLGLLVGFKMTASKNKARIALVQPAKPVADILYISKLDGIFEILDGAAGEEVRTRLATAANRQQAGAPAPAAAGAFGGGFGADDKPAAAGVSADWMNSKLDSAFSDPNAPVSAGGMGAEAAAPEPGKGQKEVIEEYCRRAVDYMRQGNYDMSVQEYNQALELDPDYLPALNNLAIVYEKQPSWAGRAMETWEKVLQLSQQRGDAKHSDRAQRHLANLKKMQG